MRAVCPVVWPAVRPARVGLSPLRMWVPCPWPAAWRGPTIALMGFLDDRARSSRPLPLRSRRKRGALIAVVRRDLEKERVQ